MIENRIQNRHSERTIKVFVNDFDDYILLDPSDTTLAMRFQRFMAWLNTRGQELQKEAAELDETYKGTPMVTENEETGETDIDLEQFGKFAEIQCSFFQEIADKLNEVFGQDVLRKYFRASYEINPEFIPDDLAIQDFLDSITPVMEQVFKTRFDRINAKYNTGRKGGRKGGKK